MQYAKFGSTDRNVSRFGLGCMRFPQDEQEAIEMVRYAIDHGVNYLDTAYAYGNSEVITGKALKDGYRDKVMLATKNPVWNVTQHSDFEKYLDMQLQRMGLDYFDVYLLHNLDPGNWGIVQKYDGLTFLDKMVEKGKIRYKAFSAHTELQPFKEIVDSFDWQMAQLQLNILDEHQQIGVEGLRYAAKKGIAMVIMEPLRGGTLLANAPTQITKLIDEFPAHRPLVEWCFRWLYNMPEVTLILSGTSNLNQLKENLRIFEHAQSNSMSEEELKLITKIRAIYESRHSIGCTGCRYCMPCPQGVAIPEIFKTYNSYELAKPHPIDKIIYQSSFAATGTGADRCVSCGACTHHCPQNLNIPDLLKTVHAELMEK